jgi:putative DNA primase/helicase
VFIICKFDINKYSIDDIGFGRYLADCLFNKYYYIPELEEWYSYSEGVWTSDIKYNNFCKDVNEICDYLKSFNPFSELLQKAKFDKNNIMTTGENGDIISNGTNEERTKIEKALAIAQFQFNEYAKFVKKIRFHNGQNGIKKQCRIYLTKSIELFDLNMFIFNVNNKTIDLRNRNIYAHNPQDLLTKKSFVNYNPNSTSTLWKKTICEIFENNQELINYVQKIMGYCLTGSVEEDKMWIIQGNMRNGKGTFLNAIFNVLGDYVSVKNSNMIMKNKAPQNSEAPTPGLYALRKKRVVFMDEVEINSSIDEQILKNWTGGGQITARGLNKPEMTFDITFKVVLVVNNLPKVLDMILFKSKRINIIPFLKTFKEEEQNKNLRNLLKNKDVQEEILLWLIEGYKKYIEERFENEPQCVKNFTNKYYMDNDEMQQFITENLVKTNNNNYHISIKEIYSSYCQWKEDIGGKSINKKELVKELEIKGLHIRRSTGNILYLFGYAFVVNDKLPANW